MSPVLLICFLAAVAFGTGSVLRAAPAPAAVNGTWFCSIDNDLFVGSDDHYSSGVQAGWVSGYLTRYGDGPTPRFILPAVESLPRINEPDRQRFVSYSISHRIFTPNDIEDPNLVPDDLPYTGLLLGSFTAGAQDAQRMDAFSLTLGVAGPWALGEDVQRFVHKIVGASRPRGWAHQIRNEPIANIAYEHRNRFLTWGSRKSLGGDLIFQGAVAGGNLLTNATLGVGARWGWRVPDDYGLPPQFFGEETIGSRPYSTKESLGLWLFGLVNGSVFGNAIFWGGNTIKESHSTGFDPFIGRAYFGVRGRWRAWSASFGWVLTTVPWDNPDDRKVQRYGRLGISYTY